MGKQQLKGWIYVVEGAGLYKLGRTSGHYGTNGRLLALQGACPVPLKLVLTREVSDCYAAERMLHQKFVEQQAKGAGREWFELSAFDLKWLKTCEIERLISEWKEDSRWPEYRTAVVDDITIREAMAALGRRNKGKTSAARKKASKANLELARQALAKKRAEAT